MLASTEFRLPFPLRPFGTQWDDLDADLSAARPYAISDTLTRCSGADAEQVWDLPVGTRIATLLALAALNGKAEFDADFDCPHCGLAVEVTLSLDELLRGAGAESVEVGGARYRLPTGRDQRAWLAAGEVNLIGVLESLRVEGDASGEAVEAALEQADPLIRTAVSAACPDCGNVTEREIDVAGAALARLADKQRHMLEGVHLLASRYHWSEPEIRALPAWRRERYLNLLRQDSR